MKAYRCLLVHFSQRYPKTIKVEQKQTKKTNASTSSVSAAPMSHPASTELDEYFSESKPDPSLFLSEEDLFKLIHTKPVQCMVCDSDGWTCVDHDYVNGWDYMNMKIQDLEWLTEISPILESIQASDEISHASM